MTVESVHKSEKSGGVGGSKRGCSTAGSAAGREKK